MEGFFHTVLLHADFTLNYRNVRAFFIRFHEEYRADDGYGDVLCLDIKMSTRGLLCGIHNDAAGLQKNPQSVRGGLNARLGPGSHFNTRSIG